MGSQFMAEDYTKAQLREAFAEGVNVIMPAKTKKADLVIAYYDLNQKQQAAVRRHLVENDPREAEPEPKKAKATKKAAAGNGSAGVSIPEFPKTGQYSHITAWLMLKGQKRGIYGTDAVVDGDTIHFTKVNGDTVDISLSDVAAAAGENPQLVEAVS